MEWKPILEMSALILSLVNGLMLLRSYLRDRPKLTVRPVHPDTYQWFFTLPSGKYQNQTTRKYGFLVYIDIINRGIRDVSLDNWYLYLKTVGKKWVELKSLNIPQEPQIKLGQSSSVKVYPILGQKGLLSQGETMVRAGGIVSGFAYYIADFYGGDVWDPLLKEGKATGKIVVQSVFGNKTSAEVLFTKIPLEKAKEMVEGIDYFDLSEVTSSNSE